MVTKEEVLEFMQSGAYKPLLPQEIISVFKGADAGQLSALLKEMEANGEIFLNKADRYGLPEQFNLKVGRLQGHPKGFGFVIPDAGGQDVFITPDGMNGAMHNDRVVSRLHGKGFDGKREEGEIIKVLSRANSQVVGIYQKSKHFGFVVPDESRINQDIFIPGADSLTARNGDRVVAEITQWPENHKKPEGKITRVIGAKDAPGTDIEAIIWKYNLPQEFPEEVRREVSNISAEITKEDLEARHDLRDLLMVTIDGEDAKDLDDAVSIEKIPNGFRLGVHIADVAYYVREGSKLDKEAYNRGTSVYLADRVIPMLPRELSNGLCSLNPQEDKLTMTCFMDINIEGKVTAHEIVPSVININERMTYKNVAKILVDKDPELMQRYDYLVGSFQMMEELSLILNKRRIDRGAIDFDFPESKVILDDKGHTIDIIKFERTVAEKIIEEFMLAANETIAEHMYWLEVPFLYRVHEDPSEEKLELLNGFINTFGYNIKGLSKIHPKALQKVVHKAKGKREEKVINMVLLRSMKQARYSEESTGHFGLAAQYYSHFTSPIRRYPDLVIHRVIREALFDKSLGSKQKERLKKKMPITAQHTSQRERQAEEAERETKDLKKVEFMKDKVGQEFDGTISGVTSFGMFVELESSVEGLIRVSGLTDDFYRYIEEKFYLIGEHTKKIYRMGDPIRVKLVKVNVSEKQIDFDLIESQIDKE